MSSDEQELSKIFEEWVKRDRTSNKKRADILQTSLDNGTLEGRPSIQNAIKAFIEAVNYNENANIDTKGFIYRIIAIEYLRGEAIKLIKAELSRENWHCWCSGITHGFSKEN